MNDCIFCKITKKEISAEIIAENDHAIAFPDRSPHAPIHYLIVPKQHVINIKDLKDGHQVVTWAMLSLAQELAAEKGVDFNLVSNNGAKAGQVVFHMHWHFLAGKELSLTE
jgi:histidine triad (HIT) family protein